MKTQQFPGQIIWKSLVALLLVVLVVQSFGLNGLAAPVAPTLNYQQEVPLSCTPSTGSTQAFCNVQVVLMIDDSGSMTTNDPQNNPDGGLRNQGAKNAVDILARNYYLNAVNFNKENPDVPLPVVQVAVIHFSYEVKNKDVDWITIDPASAEDWESQKVALFELIDRRNPGYELTSFIEPFEKARDLLDGSDPGGDCTRRSILLFTDGVPEAAKGRLLGQDLQDHMDSVASTVAEIQEKQAGDPVEIYVTGFKVIETYWTPVLGFWTEIAKSPTGDEEPKRAESLVEEDALTELASRMEAITAKLIGLERVTLASESLNVPRHIQTLRLTLYNLDPDASLQITGPDGLINAGDNNVTVSGADTAIEVWQLTTPPAGPYTVRATGTGGIITELRTYQSLSADLSVEPSPLQAGQPGVIRFSLVDTSGETVLPDEDPLKLNVTVTLVSQKFPIEWTGNTFQFPWTPSAEGRSQFDIVASLVNASGDQLLGCSGNLEVDVVSPPVEALSMDITAPACVSPAEGATLPVQLNYAGSDQAWAASIQWEVSAKRSPGDIAVNASATPRSTSGTSALYDLRIDPFPGGTGEQVVELIATAQMIGRTPGITSSQTVNIQVCEIDCSCDALWEIWFWPLLILLVVLLIVLLVVKFRTEPREKGYGYSEDRRDLSRSVFWHLLFWPLLILLILLVLNKWWWCCVIPLWLFLILLLVLLVIFILFWFMPGEPGSRQRWWLLILLTLAVTVGFTLFGSFSIWLLLLLLLMWIGILVLVWMFFWEEERRTTFLTWVVLTLLLILAVVAFIYFSSFWIYLLLWLLVLLVLVWIISRLKPSTPTNGGYSPVMPEKDDLKIIEGIGPQVEKLLNSRGIFTFRQVVDADLDELNNWLNERGWSYLDPKTWLEQAELADKAKKSGSQEDWDEFYKLTVFLKGGIVPDEYHKPEKDRKPPKKRNDPE